MSFAALLKRLRLAREATMVREYHGTPSIETRTLSQNELARRAGVTAGFVNKLEHGCRPTPTRWAVLRLASALELGPEERAALLVAAGYWPWTDLDQDTCDLVLASALAIVRGDWRRLDSTRHSVAGPSRAGTSSSTTSSIPSSSTS
jgi:DNA-binding XRE family transcriptional regulator